MAMELPKEKIDMKRDGKGKFYYKKDGVDSVAFGVMIYFFRMEV